MFLTSGICNISRSNRNSTRQLEVHSNIHSCGYIGVNMGVHGSDVDHWSERVPVMSILHRTYRVTCLRVIYLLNTRQGVREKFTKKVSDETEMFRRGYRNSSGETEKLFQGIPLSQIGSGTCLEILQGCQNHSGKLWSFSWEKTENVPEQPEPLWLLFAEETLFRNCFGMHSKLFWWVLELL